MDMVRRAIVNMIGAFKKFFGLISSYVTKIVDWIQNKISEFIIRQFVLPKFEGDMEEYKAAILKVISIMIVLAMAIGGFIGTGISMTIIKLLSMAKSKYDDWRKQKNEDYVAEAEIDHVAMSTAIVTGAVGLYHTDAESIRKRCLQLTALMAGGTVMSKGVHALWLVLPEALRMAFIAKFAPEAYKDKIAVTEWKNKAQTLLTASRTQSVIGSKVFQECVAECMKEGTTIIKKVQDPGLRAVFVRIYGRLS